MVFTFKAIWQLGLFSDLRKAVHGDSTVCCPCQEALRPFTAVTRLDLEEKEPPRVAMEGSSQNTAETKEQRPELRLSAKQDSHQRLSCAEIPSAAPRSLASAGPCSPGADLWSPKSPR